MPHTVYTVNGKRVSSVTTIIGNNLGWNFYPLLNWNLKLVREGLDPKEELRSAGRIGTLAHYMIEQFTIGGRVQNLEIYSALEISQAKKSYYNYLNFKNDYKPEILHSELKMVSEKYKFGGTCDAVAKVKIGKNKKLMILDWKSSNSIHSEHKIQIAAYAKMYEENSGKRIKGALIVRLDKDKKEYEVEHLKIKDLNWGWKVFKLILKLQELKR
jgi:CRISPR/Cas system-associated exonuclease Cas4 (RecB family)